MPQNPVQDDPLKEPVKAIRLELPLSVHRHLRVVAAHKELPMSALVRRLVLEFLERQKRS